MSSTGKLKRRARERAARNGESYQSALQHLRNAHSSDLGYVDRKPEPADAAGQQPSVVTADGERLEAASTAGQAPSAAAPAVMSEAPISPEAGVTWLSEAIRAERELTESFRDPGGLRATRELMERFRDPGGIRAMKELMENVRDPGGLRAAKELME
ncbi:hypothetical protein LZ199_45665, partial [Myxococcus sp. QH3KD-4-1]|nr:hypothetical protein [Myxococcus qinghaiensis]